MPVTTAPSSTLGRRPEIAASWHRSQLAGLRRDSVVDNVFREFDADSRLRIAAEPVLNELSIHIEGSDVGCMLADRSGTLIARRFGTESLKREVDGMGAVEGTSFSEAQSGTNAIATPLETRRSLFVGRAEHFLIGFSHYTCYGVPILHPVTRRVEGVIDVMTSTSADPALMKSVVDRAARDIRTQLMGTYDLNLTAVYAAFHAIQRATTDAVVLVGDDIVLNNRHAVDLLEPDDYVMLRSVVLERPGFSGTISATLHSGMDVLVKVTEMGAPPAVLFQLREAAVLPPVIPRSTTATERVSVLDRSIDRLRHNVGSILVSGEPGSGRSWCAREITNGLDAEYLDIADLIRHGEAHAARALDLLLDAGLSCLIVDDVDMLPDFAGARLARVLSQRTIDKVVLTMRDHADPPPQLRYLQAMCGAELTVPPLRDRHDELPGLVTELLRREIHTDRVRLTLSAVDALAGYPWPGNLTEMVAVLRDVVAKRSVGDVTANDLPERFRTQVRGRTLSTLQQAERAAISNALNASRGNKVHAAMRLGISRSTLYARIREYGLT